MNPTKGEREFLERLAKGPKLRIAVEGSGRARIPYACRRKGWVTIGGDEHVKDAMGYPADAYMLTDAGRAALAPTASTPSR
jgi:hypothetical protein